MSYKTEIDDVHNILCEEHLKGSVDLRHMACRVVAKLFHVPENLIVKNDNNEKIDLPDMHKRHAALRKQLSNA